MSTLANLRKQCAKVGATLEHDEDGRLEVYQCVAPDGFFWKASDSYHLVLSWMPGCPDSKKAKMEAIEDALERVALGLREMTEAEKDDVGD